MRVRGPNNDGRAVQMDPTLFFGPTLRRSRNKRNVGSLLAQKFDRFQPLRNNSQQHAKTYNNMQQGVKRTQHVTSHNVGSCWPTMLRPLARGFMNLLNARPRAKKTSRREIKSHEEGMSISFDR